MTAAVRAVLFDKDGTLIDFHRSWTVIIRSAARALCGADPSRTKHLLSTGGWDGDLDQARPGSVYAQGSNGEIAALWAAHLGRNDAEALARWLNDWLAQEGPRSAVAVTDLDRLFARLRRLDLRLGIATMDTEASARACAEKFGVTHHLEFVCGYDSGAGVKPGPGMVMAFADRLGLHPRDIAVVGDSPHDLAMARAAGAGRAIGVLDGTGTRALLAPLADHLIASIDDHQGLLDALHSAI